MSGRESNRDYSLEKIRWWKKASGIQPIDSLTEMYIRLYVLGTARFICEWILGKYQAASEELAMVFEQTLPAPLQKYL